MSSGHAAAGAETRIAVCLGRALGFVAETGHLVEGAVGIFAERKIGAGSELCVAELTTETCGFETGAGVRVCNESLPVCARWGFGALSPRTIGLV